MEKSKILVRNIWILSLSGYERKNVRLYTLCENARNDKDNIMDIYKKACL